MLSIRCKATATIAMSALVGDARGDEPQSPVDPGCVASLDRFFIDEVWGKVASQSCLQCHQIGGDAEESAFVLVDPQRVGLGVGLRRNREVYERSSPLLQDWGGLDSRAGSLAWTCFCRS